ncbi:hypothetical protein [Streptomyces sp. NPDC056105]|uniref:hypothetical protein n=1 Tax=Streptomyces sp. NPDC056105 TaxID=3345714 RepID=UPI0035D65693
MARPVLAAVRLRRCTIDDNRGAAQLGQSAPLGRPVKFFPVDDPATGDLTYVAAVAVGQGGP